MKPLLFLTILAGLTTAIGAQTNVSVELADISFGDVRFAGFLINEDRQIRIEAIGGGVKEKTKSRYENFNDPSGMFVRSWILDATSRQVVWQLSLDNTTSKNGLSFLRQFDGEILLPAGRYEVYLSSVKPPKIRDKEGYWSLGEMLRHFISPREDSEDWADRGSIVVTGIDEIYSAADVTVYQRSLLQDAIVNLSGVRDSEYRAASFTLIRSATVDIYGVGEAFGGSCYDYGWIIDLESGNKIWEMLPDEGEPAGGAQKNRLWRDEITLEKGNYRAVYQTDDSHSFDAWNSAPPFDPAFWGMIIRPARRNAGEKIFEPYQAQSGDPVLEINRVGNSQLRRLGFQVDPAANIRIVALGEGSDGEMSDYAWITNMETGRKVWEMRYEETERAGGASKNRLADKTLRLAKGRYMLYYVTDGSHAYGSWNSSRPPEEERWGVQIYANGGKANRIIREIDYSHPENVAVAIRDIGDNEFVDKSFRVKRKVTALVYALGEGSDGQMYDYGWILQANSRKKIWEMDYWKTSHAGGSYKNRFVEEPLVLQPGVYQLHFQTDDSHSPANWNSTVPENAADWGIALIVDRQDKSAFEVIEAEFGPEDKPLISLWEVRDDEYVQRIFELKKLTPLKVVALGEGSGGAMYDYGWIEEATSGRTVWEMEYYHTRHAGGAHKNREVIKQIDLPAGRYKLCYRTDDSHSYPDFNQSAPRDPRRWGIALYVGRQYQDAIESVEPPPRSAGGKVIAEISRVRDHEHVRRQFTLPTRSRIRISAVGEGDQGEMFDYGWIEDRSVREVRWIMQYHETDWAGGARKNRRTQTIITLPAGDYLLHFVTDDSHAYGGWNSSAPSEPESYGIRLELLD